MTINLTNLATKRDTIIFVYLASSNFCVTWMTTMTSHEMRGHVGKKKRGESGANL